MNTIAQRPCTILESLEQSLKEMNLMREGKMPKRSWREMFERIEKEALEEESVESSDGANI